MKLYVRIFFTLMTAITFALGALPAKAQNILLERSDVDSSRSGFITATYIFGVDIVTEDLERANLVSFELTYNNTEHVHFSEWSIINFGDSARAQVHSKVNEAAGTGVVTAAVYSGDTIGSRGYDNPAVIHLEFVVSQAARHGTQVTFNFTNANAVITLEDGSGADIELNSEPIVYQINSFVTVWPGDANNDGLVSVLDYNRVALFFQSDSAKKAWKSFKRKNASTKWVPQRVLSWDNDTAAYADCDGNGEITVDDLAVVRLNIDSTHFGKMKKEGRILGDENNRKSEFPSDAVRIPLRVGYSSEYIAATAHIFLNDNQKSRFLGIENGSMFNDEESILFENLNNNELELFVSSAGNEKGGQKGIICYLVFEKDIAEYDLNVMDLKGMSQDGYFFSLEEVSSVKNVLNSDNSVSIRFSDGRLHINIEKVDFKGSLKLYNQEGRLMFEKRNIGGGRSEISMLDVPSGAYFALVQSSNKFWLRPLLILE